MPFNTFFNLAQINDIDPELVNEEGFLELIIKYNGDISMVAMELGADIEILNSDYAIITIHISRIQQIYNYSEVEYIELPKLLTYFLSESLGRACISAVQSTQRFGLTGAGVIIGIIDSGIDYTHPDLLNDDNTTRIISIWDQTIQGTPPSGFRNGTEFTKTQLNTALASDDPFTIVPSRDDEGHGTAVSGIAAGNGRTSNGRERGAATKAELIVVKLGHRGTESFARTTEIMRAIKYITDKAEQLNMPVSINLSYGTNDGSHAGDSLFETYIDSMSQTWKTVISAATGNEGTAGHHFSAVLSEGETIVIDFVTIGLIENLYMTLWKNFADNFSYELISPSGRSSGVIRANQRQVFITLDNVLVSFLLGQPTHYNYDQELFFSFRALNGTVPNGIWQLKVNALQVVDGNLNVWLPTIEDVSRDTAFLNPVIETTLTLPSTAMSVISVGGYNAVINSVAEFSGRGYTRSIINIKPDIVAPAVGILSTRSGGGYDTFTGTSMAAPFVTGSAALMMEWGIVRGNDPFLYGQRIKAFLRKGATRLGFIEYPNPIWGYGALCLNRSMEYLVEFTSGGISR
ncbi:MAG TPA: hypothetical protein DD733_12880 [Clostridiales bacterium]|nr:hypothetical protein [Clostridiales bacterium]